MVLSWLRWCLLHHLLLLRRGIVVRARRWELLLLLGRWVITVGLLLLGWRRLVVVVSTVVVATVVVVTTRTAALRDDANIVGREDAFTLGVDVLAAPPVVVQFLEHLHTLALVKRQISGSVGLEVVHGLTHLNATGTRATVRWGTRGWWSGGTTHECLLVVSVVVVSGFHSSKRGQGGGSRGVLCRDLVHELIKQLGRDDV